MVGGERAVEGRGVAEVPQQRVVGGGRPADALLPEVPHEELEADQGEDGQREHRQDHDVHHLLHRLDQSAHDGLQTWGHGGGQTVLRRYSDDAPGPQNKWLPGRTRGWAINHILIVILFFGSNDLQTNIIKFNIFIRTLLFDLNIFYLF